ncbi:MAG TPA: hypothetical protein VIV40_08615 [Kofleriaceae bacterium]
MSARRKTPTADENKKTAIFESGKHGKRPQPTQYGEGDETVVDGPLGGPTIDEQVAPSSSKGAPTVLAKPAPKPPVVPGKPNAAPTVLVKPAPQAVAGTSNAPPTEFAKPVQKSAAQPGSAAPIQVISKKDQSAPIQAISMKTPGKLAAVTEANPPTPILPRPKLRAVAEVSPPQKQQNLGNLASPYDPKEARARAMREYIIYGCLAVILASGITLVVWFVAR